MTGDGGFGQYAMELTTAVKYGMPLKHVLLDNHGLGKISKEQIAGDFPVWQTSLVNPDWAEFARMCGATGLTVRSTTELDAAMAELFATPDPPSCTSNRTASSSDHPTSPERDRR